MSKRDCSRFTSAPLLLPRRRGTLPGSLAAGLLLCQAAGAAADSATPNEAMSEAVVVGEPLAAAGVAPVARAPGLHAANTLYSHGDPTPQEQLMLELVNRARANPAAEAARLGLTPRFCRGYLAECLTYTFGPAERAGLHLFWNHVRTYL